MDKKPEELTAREWRSSSALSGIFALRMLGLFLIVPVFSIYAQNLDGGNDKFLVGLTLGIYGLTQGLLQIPYGIASDRFGRKPVIALGLAIFAIGSIIDALADTVLVTLIGRAVQGAGAISAAVTAMLADSVRIAVVTKAMAFIGSSISLTFAFSLVASPILANFIGVPGLFWLLTILCVISIGVIYWIVPDVPPLNRKQKHAHWTAIAFGLDLLRLNIGIFLLHTMLIALFVAIPFILSELGVALEWHWAIYLPTVGASFLFLLPALNKAESHGRTKELFLCAILALLFVFLALFLFPSRLFAVSLFLFCFFVAFNILEANLPALVTKTAPENDKGLALGVYNTTQSIGLFVGGAAGGWIFQHYGSEGIFLFCASLTSVWFLLAYGMKVPAANKK